MNRWRCCFVLDRYCAGSCISLLGAAEGMEVMLVKKYSSADEILKVFLFLYSTMFMKHSIKLYNKQ